MACYLVWRLSQRWLTIDHLCTPKRHPCTIINPILLTYLFLKDTIHCPCGQVMACIFKIEKIKKYHVIKRVCINWQISDHLNSCEKAPYLLLSVSYGYILEKYWPCDNSTVSTAPLMWWLVYHIHVYVCGPVDCYTLLDGWHYEYQWGMRHGLLVAGIALLWLVGLK